jgi:hypothetical protein
VLGLKMVAIAAILVSGVTGVTIPLGMVMSLDSSGLFTI